MYFIYFYSMMIKSDIFDLVVDDTLINFNLQQTVFLFVFVEMYIRNNTNIRILNRTIYACNWYLNSGFEDIINSYYKHKHEWLIPVGICEVDMIGPYRNPGIRRINKTYTTPINSDNVHIIRIKDDSDFIMY